jgi:HEAT repeat protein
LSSAVEAYVLAGAGGGFRARQALDEAITVARQQPASPAIADAVESLLRFAARDEAALERARALVTPGVAALLVGRLSCIEDEARRARLIQRLPDLGHEIRAAALEALRSPTPGGAVDGGLDGGALSLVATLVRSTPDMLEELVKDPDWRVVRAAVQITAERGGDGALQILTLALAHDHPRVRRQALSALRKLGGGEAGELALGMLKDRDRGVRAEAARTVGDLNVSRGLGPLLERLDEEDHPEGLVAIVRALGALGDPSAVPALEACSKGLLLGGSDLEVRLASFHSLHRIGSPQARRVLESAQDDRSPEVRGLVASLLPGGGGAGYGPGEISPSAPGSGESEK